jgi:signal transduction histidine kinase
MALEEVAFLQTMLADADQKLTVLKDAQFSEAPFKAQLEEITSITEEIRQPLSSLVGYVDFLLSESVGILGSAQRKYLERIKVSVERVNRLVDDLLQVVARETHLASLDLGEANLGMILQSAVAENNKALRQKHITLRMDLGDTPLYVYTDQLALRKVLVSLFQNAASVSPEGSRVSVSAHLQSSEGEEDYVLVQINDSGGGIAPQDLPHVFLPPRPGGDGRITGISDLDMRGVKIAIESLGGRTWVDSEPGVGASFSILLPVTAAGKLQTGLQAA